MLKKSLYGFSLIEVIIVISISFLILAALYTVYSQGITFWYNADTNIEVMQDARKAMDQMIEELANSANSKCTVSTTLATNDTITFQTPSSINNNGDITWGNQISYYRGGTSNKQLVRSESSATKVLCNNLENTDNDSDGTTGLKFTKTTTSIGTIVSITMQTRKTSKDGRVLAAALSSSVRLRNE